MYLIAIAWMYVVLMMAVAEATNTTGSLLGATITFVLYGLLPISLVVYLMGSPLRRRQRKAEEAAEVAAYQADQAALAEASNTPDAGGEPATSPLVTPVRKEP
jgi:membrane protein implicated in regulation of membrane protease activity